MNVKVILVQQIDGLGNKGDIVEVAPGYARNYLLPHKLALEATESNIKVWRESQQRIEQEKAKASVMLEESAQKLKGLKLAISAKASKEGSLYGSVGTNEIIAEIATRTGLEMNKKQIMLDQPIKAVGKYKIPIKLDKETEVAVQLEVISEAATS